jgi:hypothetical protein
MTKATIVQLANDVVDQLNKKQGGWSVGFRAERKYQPKVDFEDLKAVQVQVVPLTWNFELKSRSPDYGWLNTYVIGIGINYRSNPKAGDQAISRFDDYLLLVEEITDYWKDLYRTSSLLSDCSIAGVDLGGATGAPYHHEVIETQNQFTSVIQVTFQKYR